MIVIQSDTHTSSQNCSEADTRCDQIVLHRTTVAATSCSCIWNPIAGNLPDWLSDYRDEAHKHSGWLDVWLCGIVLNCKKAEPGIRRTLIKRLDSKHHKFYGLCFVIKPGGLFAVCSSTRRNIACSKFCFNLWRHNFKKSWKADFFWGVQRQLMWEIFLLNVEFVS